MDFTWMAWTMPTTIFFVVIFGLILSMAVWEYLSPGGNPRTGILRFETTRGDRLSSISLGSVLLDRTCGGLLLSP